ncbi:Metallo-dependent phosphatase [Nadsonia fulvescens var. elongata DSM 6958]|uniref:Metallo-dependent phosphatase n=1 Tax=Nadsonia fulvescens var. elongata DSM 6958 TaxID=857566 RepID=A0A1E3PMR3_9ASCO|nr:Metallo-dependent phosphatase [Nadsonia fulvescens var. elongata DSM 6958]
MISSKLVVSNLLVLLTTLLFSINAVYANAIVEDTQLIFPLQVGPLANTQDGILDVNPLAAISKNLSSSNIRPLEWGQLNFLHTTDTHGWLPGHLMEPSYSADWGDYISFIRHMRQRADEKGVDILIIDTGDKHDGNGLSDATLPPGYLSQDIFKMADIDLLTLGNHELYRAEIAKQEFDVIAQHYAEKYLVANVDIILDNGTIVPMGRKYRHFQTKNLQLNIMSFGFLYDFFQNAPNTIVTSVVDTVQQDWFQDLLRSREFDIDIFVLVTHIPVRDFPELEVIVNEIRKYYLDTPIQIFGAHTHVRDFTIFDDKAYAIESGRFLETVGWVSVKGLNKTEKDTSIEPLGENQVNSTYNVTRKYIDFNRDSLMFHSNTTSDQFVIPAGAKVSELIHEARELLNLTELYGCIPDSYYTTRAKYPSSQSIFTLIVDKILPLLKSPIEAISARFDNPRMIIVNTGSVRFDLFKGPFTKDTGFLISPFKNDWSFIPDMPVSLAVKLLPILNQDTRTLAELGLHFDQNKQKCHDYYNTIGYSHLGVPTDLHDCELYYNQFMHHDNDEGNDNDGGIDLEMIFEWSKIIPRKFLYTLVSTYRMLSKKSQLSVGYVTIDDFGTEGDDTMHTPLPYYHLPNAVQSIQNFSFEEISRFLEGQKLNYKKVESEIETKAEDEEEPTIDVIFYSFITPFLLSALEELEVREQYADKIQFYGGKSLIGLLQEFVEGGWKFDYCE